MKIPIQNIDFRKSTYERPNQKWVCGWVAEGKPCPHGPNGKGKCAIEDHSTCTPYKDQSSGRFHCNRPTVFGGECEEGPRPDGTCCRPKAVYHPCQPRLSLRAKRRRLTWFVFVLTFVLMTVLLASTVKWSFFSPGPLNPSHAALDANRQLNCATCHVAGDMTLAQWIPLAFKQSNHQQETRTQCIACHFNKDEMTALSPHNMTSLVKEQPENTLDASHDETNDAKSDQDDVAPESNALTFLNASDWLHNEPWKQPTGMDCVNCHKEHQGHNSAALSMTNLQCQSCHTERFNGFVDGHPEFGVKSAADQALLFNHKGHKKYFEEEKLPCLQCHASQDGLPKMSLLSFEQSCQGCHHQGSTDHHDDSLKKDTLAVFDLPYIALDDEDAWPQDAVASELSGIMIALLVGHESSKDYVHTIYLSEDDDGADGDLEYWLDEQDDEDKIAFAQSIKDVMASLSLAKPNAMKTTRTLLTSSIGDYVPNSVIEDLSETLVGSGALLSIFNQYVNGEIDADLNYEDSFSGWVLNSEEFSLNYRAIVHGDPLFASLMQTSAFLNKHMADIEQPEIVAIADSLNDTFKSCSTCHNSQAMAPMNWSSDSILRDPMGFGRFSHETHVSTGDKLAQCANCHTQSDDKNHDFSAIEKSTCTSCHSPKTQLDHCTTCHQYHNFNFSVMNSAGSTRKEDNP